MPVLPPYVPDCEVDTSLTIEARRLEKLRIGYRARTFTGRQHPGNKSFDQILRRCMSRANPGHHPAPPCGCPAIAILVQIFLDMILSRIPTQYTNSSSWLFQNIGNRFRSCFSADFPDPHKLCRIQYVSGIGQPSIAPKKIAVKFPGAPWPRTLTPELNARLATGNHLRHQN
jgi:hypothetical protein